MTYGHNWEQKGRQGSKMGSERRVERAKEAAHGMQRRSADQQVSSPPMPQEANQQQDEKVV